MTDALRPFLGRMIAVVVSWIAAQVAVRYGIDVPQEAQKQLVEAVVNLVAVMLGMYALLHKGLNKGINPGDAASSHLAADEARETRSLKLGLKKYVR